MEDLGSAQEESISSELLSKCYQAAFFEALEVLAPKYPLVEEATEKALEIYEKRVALSGAPRTPVSWVRVVARNEAIRLSKTPRAQNVSLTGQLFEPEFRKKYDLRLEIWRDHFRKHLPLARAALTPLQNRVLEGMLGTQSNSEAAESAGVSTRDFREIRRQIIKKLRKVIPPPPLIGNV